MSEREAIFEKIEARRKEIPAGELKELGWREKWVFQLADWYEVTRLAYEKTRPTEPKWRRTMREVLKYVKIVLTIVAGFYARKL